MATVKGFLYRPDNRLYLHERFRKSKALLEAVPAARRLPPEVHSGRQKENRFCRFLLIEMTGGCELSRGGVEDPFMLVVLLTVFGIVTLLTLTYVKVK